MNKIEDLGEFIEVSNGLEKHLINKRHIISVYQGFGSKIECKMTIENHVEKISVSEKYEDIKKKII